MRGCFAVSSVRMEDHSKVLGRWVGVRSTGKWNRGWVVPGRVAYFS
jgi:hypothetical protein